MAYRRCQVFFATAALAARPLPQFIRVGVRGRFLPPSLMPVKLAALRNC
jgi:hypothetical protein